jgi:hypothetical protein
MKTRLIQFAAAVLIAFAPGCSALFTERDVITEKKTPSGTVLLTNSVVPFDAAISAGRTLNSGIPHPFQNAVDGALVVTGILGAVAGTIFRNKARNAQAVADTIIAGVEQLNDPRVKQTIHAAAVNAGTAAMVHKRVEQVTGK